MGYQGWKNYETWAVALWIDNNESDHRRWNDAAQTALDDAKATSYASRVEIAGISLADSLRDDIGGAAPELKGLWADLLTAAIGEVNWGELADHYLLGKTPFDADEDGEPTAKEGV